MLQVGQCPKTPNGQAKPARLDQACLAASGLRRRPALLPGRSTIPQKWVLSLLTVIRIDQMQSDVLNRHFLDPRQKKTSSDNV
jgi:hypothetical protein